MKNTVDIGDFSIGSSEPCFLIAEVAQAHDGSLGIAHSYIDAIADAGFDAVKFQTHIASAESTIGEPFRVNFSYVDRSRYDYWKRMEFTVDQWRGLKEHAEERGVIFLSSVFSIEAAQMMQEIGIAAWKIGSGETNNLILLDYLTETNKPILLSTGMSGWGEIESVTKRVTDSDAELILFQCTSAYPTPLSDVGLNVLNDMMERFDLLVGLSDHSGTIYPSLLAMARGASLIEVHATFHKKMFGPDVSASLDFSQLKQISSARDAFYEMDSNIIDKDKMAFSLEGMRILFNKSVALLSDQVAGTVLKREMLTTKKPGTGIPADQIECCVGEKQLHNVSADELLSFSDFVKKNKI